MTNLIGDSNDPNVAAVFGEHTAGQAAVVGQSTGGRGVLGISEIGQGVWGHSVSSTGVVGVSTSGWGTSGESDTGPGVVGQSKQGEGVRGVSHSEHGAVVGVNDFSPESPPGAGGNGGWFESTQGEGVRGLAKTPHHGGVVGVNTAGGFGVYGTSDGNGVVGESTSNQGVGVFGKGGRLAGFFEGDVEVTGDIRLSNADCAEDFDIAGVETIEPGTVMVLGEGGTLKQSERAYDKCVAGVISGAGGYKPGIVLDKQNSQSKRMPIALLGKVYCKVDARYAPIQVGDLLTTAPTPGHAMKADDPLKAFGAVIGKALQPLPEGLGLIPVLIALQ